MALDLQKQKEIAERQREIAEQANLAKSSFLAAASHDLRQPIHALGIFVGAFRGVAMASEGRESSNRSRPRPRRWMASFPRFSTFRDRRRGRGRGKRAFAIGLVLERLWRPSGRSKSQGRLARLQAMLGDRLDRSGADRARLRNLVSNAARYTDAGGS